MEKFGDGPAAVFGDETCIKPLSEALSSEFVEGPKGQDGKAQGIGRSESQKTCLGILHE